jgi:hypothetical protein
LTSELPDLPCLNVPRLDATDRLVALPPFPLKDARDGREPRLKTSVRVGWRDGALLVRFDGRDDHVVATITARNRPLWTEDVFEVFLSPHDPARRYYEIEVNPLGALFAARIDSPELARKTMKVDTAWDCRGLAARVRRTPRRWSATLSIPLSELAEGNSARTWRANFFRIDRSQQDEYSAWSPTYQDPPDFHVPSRFGALRLPA